MLYVPPTSRQAAEYSLTAHSLLLAWRSPEGEMGGGRGGGRGRWGSIFTVSTAGLSGESKNTQEEGGKERGRGRRAVCGHDGEPGTGSVLLSTGREWEISGREKPFEGTSLTPFKLSVSNRACFSS